MRIELELEDVNVMYNVVQSIMENNNMEWDVLGNFEGMTVEECGKMIDATLCRVNEECIEQEVDR